MTDDQVDRIIHKCKSVERPGLYFMVLICILHACDMSDSSDRLKRIEKKLGAGNVVLVDTNAPPISTETK